MAGDGSDASRANSLASGGTEFGTARSHQTEDERPRVPLEPVINVVNQTSNENAINTVNTVESRTGNNKRG